MNKLELIAENIKNNKLDEALKLCKNYEEVEDRKIINNF